MSEPLNATGAHGTKRALFELSDVTRDYQSDPGSLIREVACALNVHELPEEERLADWDHAGSIDSIEQKLQELSTAELVSLRRKLEGITAVDEETASVVKQLIQKSFHNRVKAGLSKAFMKALEDFGITTDLPTDIYIDCSCNTRTIHTEAQLSCSPNRPFQTYPAVLVEFQYFGEQGGAGGYRPIPGLFDYIKDQFPHLTFFYSQDSIRLSVLVPMWRVEEGRITEGEEEPNLREEISQIAEPTADEVEATLTS